MVNNREINIIIHEENQGYSAAVLANFKNATGDIIITIDSDGQHNPEEIPALIKPIINSKVDIVVGSRYLGKYQYKIPISINPHKLVISNVNFIKITKSVISCILYSIF